MILTKKKEFYEKKWKKTAGFLIRWLWKFEDNRKWINEIIKMIISNNLIGNVRYFEKSRWKKIKNFDYENDIVNDNNSLIFYWDWEKELLFSIVIELEDRFVWKGEKQKLYKCTKTIVFSVYNEIINDEILINYFKLLSEKFKVVYGILVWNFSEENNPRKYENKICPWRGYSSTNFINTISIIWPFIFQKIVDKEKFIEKIKPIVYKLEEMEDGGLYIQVNEKNPLNLDTKVNQKNYIVYLKALAEILPIWGVQSIYHDAYMIEKFGALEWRWNLISDVADFGKIYYDLIKEHAPEVLDENGDFKISEEDWKLLGKLPQAKYKYITEER